MSASAAATASAAWTPAALSAPWRGRERGERGRSRSEATFNGPKAIRCDRAGNVYVVDTENHALRKVEAKTWRVSTVVGGREGAGLDRPHGCVLDRDGTLYIADTNNHRIRRVRPGRRSP